MRVELCKYPISGKFSLPFMMITNDTTANRSIPMPKRTLPTNRPEILLNAQSPIPLYKQLYERLRRAILAGQLQRGTRPPSTRRLSNELGISRTTLVLAYENLLGECYLEVPLGEGTVGAHGLPSALLRHEADPEHAQP